MAWTRRDLLKTGAAAAAGLATVGWLDAACAEALEKPMPMRTLGRTGLKVSALGFGSGPLGHSFQPQDVFDRIVGEALDLGVNYIDTATNYDVSEERLGPIVKRNRKRIVLATKTRGRNKAEALKTLEDSLRLLQTDYVDVAHLHNIPYQDTTRLMDENSPLRGLQEAKKRGWIRYTGITAHYRVPRVPTALETGEFDVIMVPLNYVDQHIYAFNARVLPLARRHRMGIAGMKVLGGPSRFSYRNPTPCQIPKDRIEHAIRWTLGVSGLATAVIGFNFDWQMRLAVAAVKSYKPLSFQERRMLAQEGRVLAAE
jgi:uncharacterized protein